MVPLPFPGVAPSWKPFRMGFWELLMSEEELRSAPSLKRGRRFDWLYDRMVTGGRLESVLSKSLELPQEVWRRLSSETITNCGRRSSAC
jgi:hypothetical protein